MADSEGPSVGRDDSHPSPVDVTTTSADSNPEAETLSRAAELLRPLLLDPAQAPQAVARLFAVTEMFRGPIPHPTHLKAYEDIVPGSGIEIFSMAKKEQNSRHRRQFFEMFYPYLGLFSDF